MSEADKPVFSVHEAVVQLEAEEVNGKGKNWIEQSMDKLFLKYLPEEALKAPPPKKK